jgi:hypothetical protein
MSLGAACLTACGSLVALTVVCLAWELWLAPLRSPSFVRRSPVSGGTANDAQRRKIQRMSVMTSETRMPVVIGK